MQYKNIFGDDFQLNQVSCQHLFRSSWRYASPSVSAPVKVGYYIISGLLQKG